MVTVSPPRSRPLRAAAGTELELLAGITAALARGDDPGDVLAEILQTLANLAGGSNAAIWVTPEQARAVVASAAADQDEIALGKRAALVVRGEVADAIMDRRDFHMSSATLPGDRLYLPLPEGGVAIRDPAAAMMGGSDALRLLQILANLAQAAVGIASQRAMAGERAAALERSRQRLLEQTVELREVAVVDGLTGLHNRRFFDLRLASEIERLERYGRPLSLLIFDLDHFKQVNDVYGHPGGDAVLQAVAGEARDKLRRTDILCRHGGEEFAVILPDTPREGSLITAERLRSAVESLVIDVGATAATVTISAGIATAEQGYTGGPLDLVRAADEALYRAKEAGRNRVEHDTPDAKA